MPCDLEAIAALVDAHLVVRCGGVLTCHPDMGGQQSRLDNLMPAHSRNHYNEDQRVKSVDRRRVGGKGRGQGRRGGGACSSGKSSEASSSWELNDDHLPVGIGSQGRGPEVRPALDKQHSRGESVSTHGRRGRETSASSRGHHLSRGSTVYLTEVPGGQQHPGSAGGNAGGEEIEAVSGDGAPPVGSRAAAVARLILLCGPEFS